MVIKYLDLMGFKPMRIYFLGVWMEEWIWKKLDGRSEGNQNTVYNILKLITKFIKISFCFTSVFNFIFWLIISFKVFWTNFCKFCSYLCYEKQNSQSISVLVPQDSYTRMKILKPLKQKQKQESFLSLVLLYIHLTHKFHVVFKIYEQHNLVYC